MFNDQEEVRLANGVTTMTKQGLRSESALANDKCLGFDF